MGEKKLKKYEFFVKYLFSYILVLVMPLSALFLFSYNHSGKLMQKNILSMQKNYVAQVTGSIDPAMKNADDIVQNIRLDNRMKNYSLEESSYNYFQAVSQLKEFLLFNKLLTSIVIYRGEDALLLSDKGTFPAQYLGDEIIRFEEWDTEELKRRLWNTEDTLSFRSLVSLPGNVKQEYLVQWYPMHDNSKEKPVIMTFINMAEISRIIRTPDSFREGYFVILDSQGNPIWEEGESLCQPEQMIHYKGRRMEGADIVYLNDEKFLVSFCLGAETGWTYYSIVRYSAISGELLNLKKVYFAILSGLLLGGSIIIYLFLYTNYVPLRRLEEHVKEGMQKEFDKVELNEIETIQQAVRFLSDGLDMVNRQMKELEPLQKDYAVYRLLKGLEYQKEYLPTFLQEEDIGVNYLVACIDPYPGDAALCQMDSVREFGKGWLKGIEMLGKPFMEKDMLIICFNSHDLERVKDMLEKLAETWGRKRSREIRFYISAPKNNISTIPKAFFEACLTWEFFSETQKGTVIVYGTVMGNRQQRPDLLDELCGRVEAAIIIGDMATMMRLPSDLENERYEGSPRHRLKETLFRLMESISIHVKEDLADVINKDLGILLEQYDGVIDWRRFRRIFSALCQDVVNLVMNQMQEDENVLKMELLIDYIEQNYMKTDFTISGIAEEFSVSPSWLSHYFKKYMHLTLIEYVNEKKMNMAKLILCESEVSLEELTINLGYSSISSFIRSFKKIVGMTPGKYREIYGKKDRNFEKD